MCPTLAEQVVKGQLRPLNQPMDDIDGPIAVETLITKSPPHRSRRA